MKDYLVSLGVVAALVGCVFVLQATPARAGDTVPAIAAAPSAADDLQVQGIVRTNSVRYASFAMKGRGMGTWFQEGEVFSHYRIEEVGPDSVKVTDLVSSTTHEIRLRQSGVTNVDASEPGGPAPYTKAWINSNANPMLYRSLPLPTEIGRNWSKLSQAERDDIAATYLKYGWKLLYSESSSGSTSFTWENLYSKERHGVISENNRAFVASLDAEQQAAWAKINTNAPIMVKGGAPTENQLAEVARRRAAHEAFVGSLTPEQLTAYRTKDDFTNADWSNAKTPKKH